MVHQDPELAKSTPERSIPVRASPRPQSTSFTFRDVADDPTVSRRTSAASRYSLALSSFPSDIGSTSPPNDIEEEGGSGSSDFTFIPSNPKKFYKRLVEICVDADLRAMANLQGDEEVSLGILSPPNLDLLDQCAVRWRIGSPYRFTVFLDIIKYKYEREEVPVDCVPEAMQLVTKTAEELPLDDWTTDDVCFHLTNISSYLTVYSLGPIPHSSLWSPIQYLPWIPLSRLRTT